MEHYDPEQAPAAERLKEEDAPEAANARYYAAIERLTAASWRALGDE